MPWASPQPSQAIPATAHALYPTKRVPPAGTQQITAFLLQSNPYLVLRNPRHARLRFHSGSFKPYLLSLPQASAAHWEARTLSDDDIADLGYGPDGDEDKPEN